MTSKFDVAAAKRLAIPFFDKWDEMVKSGASPRQIRQHRYSLWQAMLAASEPINATAGGIYVFVGGYECGSDEIVYVGRSSPTRPLRRRIRDYIKDDCAWDMALERLSSEDFEERVRIRLRSSYPFKFEEYASKHARLREWVIRSTFVVVVPINATHAAIAQIEKALIGSVPYQANDLLNKQSRKAKPLLATAERDLALHVINSCEAAGLNERSASAWRRSIGYGHNEQ